ncbi:MAG: endonuclease III [Candidatus Heimdallarchaeota archaeon]|nr:endonuclease III [Candidatus Heimdallarchaeota archaeon]
MNNSVSQRVKQILSLLEKNYPSSKGSLTNISSPFQLLTAAILSAQSTDKQVNAVTPELFERFPDPILLSHAPIEEIETLISSVGLYKNKAKFLKGMASHLTEKYNSTVPTTITELIKLPGVGRKTANVLLNDWFGIHEGIAVDTHVKRISYRLGLTENSKPNKIEEDLKLTIPEGKWGKITHLLIDHGRKICRAQEPLCNECFLSTICTRIGVIKDLKK